MKKREDPVIVRPAAKGDIKGILSIQKSLMLDNRSDPKAGKKGFIVYQLSQEELQRMIYEGQNLLLVAQGPKGIVGYALAYDLDQWRKNKPGWDEDLILDDPKKSSLSKEKILYFRHIARDEKYSGIGKKLEEQIYALAKDQGYQEVVGEILEEPVLNERSKEVHEQRGYKRIGRVKYPDGKVWGLYKKGLRQYKKTTLETALSLISIGSFILSAIFFFGITGWTVSSVSEISNQGLGLVLFLIGIFGTILLFWFKKK